MIAGQIPPQPHVTKVRDAIAILRIDAVQPGLRQDPDAVLLVASHRIDDLTRQPATDIHDFAKLLSYAQKAIAFGPNPKISLSILAQRPNRGKQLSGIAGISMALAGS